MHAGKALCRERLRPMSTNLSRLAVGGECAPAADGFHTSPPWVQRGAQRASKMAQEGAQNAQACAA
eukprot:6836834-Pyramimonas_sp.AAC.1